MKNLWQIFAFSAVCISALIGIYIILKGLVIWQMLVISAVFIAVAIEVYMFIKDLEKGDHR